MGRSLVCYRNYRCGKPSQVNQLENVFCECNKLHENTVRTVEKLDCTLKPRSVVSRERGGGWKKRENLRACAHARACVCMCVRICACASVRVVCVSMRAFVQGRACVRAHACVCVCVHSVCVLAHASACMCLCVRVCIRARMCMHAVYR